MKRTKKILITIIFILLLILLGSNKSNAGDLYLNNLDFNAQINQDGSMDVTENWDISIENTNTLFKTFKTDKSKYSSITDVQVSEIDGNNEKQFTKIDSLMYHVTKQCYYGMQNDDGNFEIAWGVGLDDSSANKKYKISYKVNDAIAKYKDYAELYWQFIGNDFEINCKKITGTILLPQNANSKEDIKVWGHTEYLNGEIYAESTNKIKFEVNNFRAGRYVEIRTLFPTSIITASGRTYSTERLDDVISEETVWANEANARRKKAEGTKKLATAIFVIVICIVDFGIAKKTLKIRKEAEERVKFKPTQELEYFREIPRKNATPAQAVYVYNEELSYVSTNQMGNIFSATLLDLSLKKYINFEENPNDKKNIIIRILNTNVEELERTERIILKYILKASGEKDKTTIKEIEKYMKRHASNLIELKENVEKASVLELEKNGLYNEKEAKEKSKYNTNSMFGFTSIISIIFVLFGLMPVLIEYINIGILIVGVLSFIILNVFKNLSIRKFAKRINVYTQEGIDEKEKWEGLKKYMEDFSLLKEREIPELVIWEHFLVYATAFGIADKVIKQLKAIYKELGKSFEFDDSSYGYMYFMTNNNFSSSFTNAMSSAFTSAYSSSYSSGTGGGGGFSGGGGGGRWPEVAAAEDNLKRGANMNIKITKNIEEANCITHAGTFHADEVFATIILSKIIPEITLIRVPEYREQEKSKTKANAIVYDIGAGEYDHHQLGGNGIRPNGVKYAACGLIWKAFGKELLKKYDVKEVNYTWNYIDKNLIQFVDANDNGQLPKLDTDYRNVHISHIVSIFNPKWDEKVDSDEKFMRALSVCEVIFDEFLHDVFSKIKAKDLIEESIENSKNGIMILDVFAPWKEFLLNSNNEKAEAINFVVFPSSRGGYNVYAVPKEIGSFENRKSLPSKWRGLKDKELQNTTGVKTARFCHNAGFICSADSKEGAMELAFLANGE